MPTPKEIVAIQEQYREEESRYRRLANYVLDRCNSFREVNPKVARIIFSREPILKTLESITQKIDDRRADKVRPDPRFDFSRINDIVAISILCPFESDIQEVARFLRETFDVEEENDEIAKRSYDSGHRGSHYAVSLRDSDVTVGTEDLVGLKCEIQVKTILAEAFDAKSHDLAYKPGRFDVGEEVKKQFSLLAAGLKAIDGQSEFLKTLIVSEQRELELRRIALLGSYLSQPDTIDAGLQMGIDLKCVPRPSLAPVVTALRKAKLSKTPSTPICRFAALCALEYGSEALKTLALQLADNLVQSDAESLGYGVLRGYVHWVLGRYESAIKAYRGVLECGRNDADSVVWVKRARNNFVYLVCDWKLFRKVDREALTAEALRYIGEILAEGDLQQNEADSVGLYKILFGDFEEIEEGRKLLKRSRATRKSAEDKRTYTQFYNLHEYVALTRLAKIAKKIFDQPV